MLHRAPSGDKPTSRQETPSFFQVPSSSQITAVVCIWNPLSLERSLLIIQVLWLQRLSNSPALNASLTGMKFFHCRKGLATLTVFVWRETIYSYQLVQVTWLLLQPSRATTGRLFCCHFTSIYKLTCSYMTCVKNWLKQIRNLGTQQN